MRERPILFSAPMVRAILEGRKTQTRRLVKPQPPAPEEVLKRAGIDFGIFTDDHARATGEYRVSGPVWAVRELMGVENPTWRCPYGSPGDRLWVRETFHGGGNGGAEVAFKADYLIARDVKRWTPAIHMPQRLSRITLEVTGVRVERLQDISEEDAKAEGAPWRIDDSVGPAEGGPLGHRVGFWQLWDSLNAKRAPWASNPWVWVVEFRRAEAAARSAA